MKIYFTYKALTKGIVIREMDERDIKIGDKTLTQLHPTYYHVHPTTQARVRVPLAWYHKPNWHLTHEEALEQARKMCIKAIKALDSKRHRLITMMQNNFKPNSLTK
jgi:hypothetical protein